MKITRTGIILNVENFDQCVAFYKAIFGLDILFEERDGDFRLVCFSFGGAYLMIETGGVALPEGKSIRDSAAKLRFNVSNIEQALDTLRSHGVEAEIQRNTWGSTLNIHDPDGNRIGIRDEPTFFAKFRS